MADTDEWLRQRVLWLVRRLGMDQKTIAGKMGISESRLSRWLNDEGARPLSTDELDRFKAFREEVSADLQRWLSDDEDARAAPSGEAAASTDDALTNRGRRRHEKTRSA